MKVREHKTLGVYVADLSKHPVDNYKSTDEIMEQGQKNRTIGCILMNALSQEHLHLLKSNFENYFFSNGRAKEKFSVINLVDLTGSE